MAGPKIRLFTEQDLAEGRAVDLSEHAHYLSAVMRQAAGAEVLLFNGRDGEWRAELTDAAKRRAAAQCLDQTLPQSLPPDLDLIFAPIKKARTDFIVEKATELGVRRIQPVFTRFTNSERVRLDKLRAHCIEAAEQCGGLHVPELFEPEPLDRLLDGWGGDRRLMFCDERMDGLAADAALRAAGGGPWAVLIGPEGGFTEDESSRLSALPFVTKVGLGPRILRADTAAVAAITLWQATLGDW
ncbi:16S rRNA (uracil(1498)-N(3))-methyltransferase [Roseobacter sp. HKCCA0434]|uniref:16S rRNA (uracil(1498)-N(3))-methyltransferase n=1 Tax=Roseobacter sp. HKCCA0434 TaxID=3079297 RepID=UPI002905C6DF|nr:16S rRNA (uracil(1498)-N(3))-methyltransferase [Roseobacter sp. HKCCA0434]